MPNLTFRVDKLQHIYDLHGRDFGLSGNKNPQQLQKLIDAIKSHLSDGHTQLVEGHYRGQGANLHFNPQTHNVVVTDKSGNIVAAYRASPAQAAYIKSTGRLN